MDVMDTNVEEMDSASDSAPLRKTDILPPCRICNEPGSGFHYGVNTCGACKAFFYRTLRFPTEYKCKGNQNCNVQPSKGRICPFCRFKKCIDVGMSKEGIKIGRYTSGKRSEYILELHKQNKGSPDLNKTRHQRIARERYTDDSMESGQENSGFSSLRSYHDMNAAVIRVSPSRNSPNPLSNDNKGASRFSPFHAISSESNVSVDSCMGPENGETEPSSASGDHHRSPATRSPAPSCTPSSSLPKDDIEYSFTSTLQPDPSREIKELYADEVSVMSVIMEGYEQAFGYYCKGITSEVISKETQEHHDMCQERSKSQDFVSSPSDAEGPMIEKEKHPFFNDYGTHLEIFLRQMVRFTKSIPGFSCLSMSEKLDLIKKSRHEFTFVFLYEYSNPDLGVFRDTSQRWICMKDLDNMYMAEKKNLFHGYLDMCRNLQSLKLSSEERVILLAMTILTPDRCRGKSSNRCRMLYWSLSKLFIYRLCKRNVNAQSMYSTIMETLNFFRTENKLLKSWFTDSNIQASLKESPLANEMLKEVLASREPVDSI